MCNYIPLIIHLLNLPDTLGNFLEFIRFSLAFSLCNLIYQLLIIPDPILMLFIILRISNKLNKHISCYYFYSYFYRYLCWLVIPKFLCLVINKIFLSSNKY